MSRRCGVIPFVRELPFAVDDSESDVFVWGARTEMQQYGLIVARFFDNPVRRGFRFINEIGVEDVELSRKSVSKSDALVVAHALCSLGPPLVVDCPCCSNATSAGEESCGYEPRRTRNVFGYICSTHNQYVRG